MQADLAPHPYQTVTAQSLRSAIEMGHAAWHADSLMEGNQSESQRQREATVNNSSGGASGLPRCPPPPPTHPHWLQYPGLPPAAHYALGSVLLAIGTAGVLGNALVLFVFTRFRRLRGPFSAFIVNLAVADLCTSLLHAAAATSSFSGHWVFGVAGCQLYACAVGHFGLLSIVTLAAIAVERYMVITAKPLSASWKMTQYTARKVCAAAWVYCLFLSVPPLLGWSRYIPEGFLTSCSWDYLTRTPANRAYYIYLLAFGFVLPVSVIAYCYTFILAAIHAHGREMKGVESAGGRRSFHRASTHRPPCSSTVRSLEIIVTLVLLFLISWTPYTVVTLIGQFGDESFITPWVASLPAFFAKASVVYNPIVYGLSHPHFRASIKQYLSGYRGPCSASGLLPTAPPPTTWGSLVLRRRPRAASSPGHVQHVRCFLPPQHRHLHHYHSEPPDPPSIDGSRSLMSSSPPMVRGHRSLGAAPAASCVVLQGERRRVCCLREAMAAAAAV
ncbi:melanopsin-like [Schistocerca gregaria]|uniref:melanopsin-like n=1 Tax=Schistocerca gregaria TaxID=7010 RepID=UPI00211DA915|nr:melanopsin-like [Schistocerca gregaria]